MKIISVSLIMALGVFGSQSVNMADTDIRESVTINREWKYRIGDWAGAENIIYDDTEWDTVGLPHSFSIPYFLGTQFYTGYGWYRKTVNISESSEEKCYSLEFDGVFQVTDVYVNGQQVGVHRGGYTGFSFDITEAVKPGDNLVAVRVNNLWDAQLAPRAGEHVFNGGIYRDVRLVTTSPLHVAWYGTFVTTPKVSHESATVNVKTEVVNASKVAKKTTVRQCIFDSNDRLITQMESTQTIKAGATIEFDQISPIIENPKLWHPDHPDMYSVKTTVMEDGKSVDDYCSPLGFRWFEWTADKGFFLNGDHFYIIGANVHQDHAGWGDAVTRAGAYRDVKMVKDAGFNFVRGSHYPHSPAFSSACDEIGALFWSEGVFWGIGGFSPDGFWNSSAYPPNVKDQQAFEASVKQQTREMIRIHRNHPSIVAWSTSNESFFSDKKVMPEIRKFLSELSSMIRELDPTRPVAHGGVQRGEIDKLDGTIAGYNGDGARIFINPGVPNIVSEYGSTIADRPGKYESGFGQLLNGPGDKSKPYFWRYPWRSGEVIWCAFDHGSLASIRFGSMGLVDYFRLPKRQWYWYRNEYNKIPPPQWPVEGEPAKLRLLADKNVIHGTDATDDVHLIVTVLDAEGNHINNCPKVTLIIESGPGQFPTGSSIEFEPDSDIVIRDGQAAIEFRSYYAGKTVIRAASEGLEDAVISITTTGQPVYDPGMISHASSISREHNIRLPIKSYSPDIMVMGNISLNRPTRVSSEHTEHVASNINDGNIDTYWRSQGDDKNPWCGIDLENLYQVDEVQVGFASEGNFRYLVQVSLNESDWITIIDRSDTDCMDRIHKAKSFSKEEVRFLRVLFTHVPPGKIAALSELSVTGRIRRRSPLEKQKTRKIKEMSEVMKKKLPEKVLESKLKNE